MFYTAEFWSVVASIVSVILGGFAIGLSVHFFVINRKTEKDVSNSLTKIETQAELLQKIAGRQLDRLTKYVTEQRSGAIDEALPQLITILAELPQTIIAQTQQPTNGNQDQLTDELIGCYIGLYFYVAQTNYWSQINLPNLSEFDENDVIHNSAKRIVDLSAADFKFISDVLEKCDATRLESHTLYHLFHETKDFWKDYVRSSSGVFKFRQMRESN